MSPSIPQPAEPLSPERHAKSVEVALRESRHVWWQTPPRLDYAAQAVVKAEPMAALLAEIERLKTRVAELEGTQEPASLALPWAHRMSDWDLHCFLDDLVAAAMNRWRTEVDGSPVPDRFTLAAVEKACAEWRTPGQGSRSDDPETTPDTEAGDR